MMPRRALPPEVVAARGSRGRGSATPSRVIDNEYLLQFIDSSDEGITQRTGIRERRWIAEGENIETLSLEAANQAIERAGIDRSEIGAVILSTISHYHQTPALAPKLATELGIPDAAAYDISAACGQFKGRLEPRPAVTTGN